MPNQPSEGETPLETPLASLCKLLVFLLLFQDVRESMQLHITTYAGFYSKLIVWGSLGLNFEYDGGPIIEIGGPIFYISFQKTEKNSL